MPEEINLTEAFKATEKMVQDQEMAKKGMPDENSKDAFQIGPEDLEKKDSIREDIIPEEKIEAETKKLETSIKALPVAMEDKTEIEETFANLIEKRTQDVMMAGQDGEEELKKLFDTVISELENFKEIPEVREIYETVAPFFDLKSQLEGCEGIWTKMEEVLNSNGIDSKMITGIQKRLGINADGKFGPKTAEALSEMLGIEHKTA